jgi:hypothetical protein
VSDAQALVLGLAYGTLGKALFELFGVHRL